MAEFLDGLNLFGLRRMFYLVTPNETSFEKLESTPNYIDQATPWFIIFILLELSYSVYKRKKYYRTNDVITSLGAGILTQTIKVLLVSVEFKLACWIYEHYAIVHLPWNSPWTWFIALIFHDFCFYWFHRYSHEINIFWAFHQVHHSSEYFNLTTALRQPMFQFVTTVFFYLPEALVVPPSAFMVHMSLNTIYQFYIHTEVIKSMGPLEYILNTPSHHRVHHGRNPYCIDKNYAAALIIWDRMFGTFQQEKQEEPVVFGLVHNVNTFDQLYCQLFVLKHIFWDKVGAMQNVGDKLKAVFCGPGWFPGAPRLGNLSDIPQIDQKSVHKYSPKIPVLLQLYTLLQFGITTFLYVAFAENRQSLSFIDCLPYVMFIILSLQSIGALFDKKPYAPYLELVRCALLYYWFFPKIWPVGSFFHGFGHAILGGCLTLWLIKVISLPQNGHEKV